ncbi:Six-hairpin glycosidase-like protein [Zychaea mexicana]|uniref:Six-hairpin glycosidase-like protein n=1 Tax=Zychaea mexicana TaxID=64656 RepID=UPI0022FE7F3E|nr:Six-hairpin glycosidase-like protein [Zychaea mexicana]KAI9489430.1 Six-hairpin glycosidase-like protein [Zychaea mexicana]
MIPSNSIALLFLLLLSYFAAPIDAQNPYYTALLNDSLYFFEAQRSGVLPDNNRVEWRHDSGLEDGSDNNVDLTGGYYDAGNYLKFTVPLSHTLTLIAWGALEWYDGYVSAGQTEHLHDMIRWGTDWLIKAHPSDNVLFVQVGEGSVDNNYWGPDSGIPTPRPSFMIDESSPGTDAAALTAAAFASSSLLLRATDEDYANTLLSHAERLYTFAESATPWQVYSDSVEASQDYYGTSTYSSQLVYGALWLYRATNNTMYRDKASNFFDQFSLRTKQITILDWHDQTGAMYVLGAAVDDSGTDKYKDAAEDYISTIINDRSGGPCSYTIGGLLWCGSQSEWSSLVIANNMAFLAAMFSHTVDETSEYDEFARAQLNYVLGDNPMKTPYVIGVHMNSPQNPHHAGASGGTSIRNIDAGETAHVLYGAIVGGPDYEDRYFDERSDYRQNEVSLNYQGSLQSLVSYQLVNNAVDPPYANITEPRPEVRRPGQSNTIAGWLIAVIVIVIIAAIVGAAIFVCFVRRRRNSAARKPTVAELEKAAAQKSPTLPISPRISSSPPPRPVTISR